MTSERPILLQLNPRNMNSYPLEEACQHIVLLSACGRWIASQLVDPWANLDPEAIPALISQAATAHLVAQNIMRGVGLARPGSPDFTTSHLLASEPPQGCSPAY